MAIATNDAESAPVAEHRSKCAFGLKEMFESVRDEEHGLRAARERIQRGEKGLADSRRRDDRRPTGTACAQGRERFERLDLDLVRSDERRVLGHTRRLAHRVRLCIPDAVRPDEVGLQWANVVACPERVELRCSQPHRRLVPPSDVPLDVGVEPALREIRRTCPTLRATATSEPPELRVESDGAVLHPGLDTVEGEQRLERGRLRDALVRRGQEPNRSVSGDDVT